MDEQKPHIIQRIFFSGILGFFAFAPSYIIFFALINIFTASFDEVSEDFLATILFLSVLFFLAYFLWLLSWRALTWKSSRSDGNLLPPIVIKIFIGAFGVIGGCIIVLAFYSEEYLKLLGGLGYMITATYAYRKYQNE